MRVKRTYVVDVADSDFLSLGDFVDHINPDEEGHYLNCAYAEVVSDEWEVIDDE